VYMCVCVCVCVYVCVITSFEAVAYIKHCSSNTILGINYFRKIIVFNITMAHDNKAKDMDYSEAIIK
jgi:hypothetical protein